MKRKLFLFLFLSMLIGASCDKKEAVNIEGFHLKLQVVSGGCGVVKTLNLNKENTEKDLSKNVCHKNSSKERYQTEQQKYQQLLMYTQNLNLFHADFKDCWRCVDGVDYILVISDGNGQTNELSISGQREEKEIVSFIKFLDTL